MPAYNNPNQYRHIKRCSIRCWWFDFFPPFLVFLRALPTCGVPPRGIWKNPTVVWGFREIYGFAWYFLTEKSHILHRDSWDFESRVVFFNNFDMKNVFLPHFSFSSHILLLKRTFVAFCVPVYTWRQRNTTVRVQKKRRCAIKSVAWYFLVVFWWPIFQHLPRDPPVGCGIFADFDVGWPTPPHVSHVWGKL